MRALPLLALLWLGACAWRPFGEPSDRKIRPVQALSDAGRPREVVAALTPQFMQTLRGTDLRQAHVLLGDNLSLLGRLDEAMSVYQVGANLFPDNVDLLTRLAGVLHRSGLDERARPLYERALKREPRHFGAHRGLAEIDRSRGHLERAADHYEVALETLERDPSVWRDYAETMLALNELRTADLALRKALELDSRSPDTHVLLAFVRRAQDELADAAAHLEHAIALGAGVGARRAKALWLLEAGKHAEAAAEAGRVLEDSPADPSALWVRARAKLSAGKDAGPELAALRAAGGLGGRVADVLKGTP